MILVTGATGTVGKALLPPLVDSGRPVRALVRDPRRLGRRRVDVQLALGDLAGLGDARLQRQALRGVHTIVHLAAAIRDRPGAPVEEVTALGTARLLRAAQEAGVERFVFFSAIGATEFQRTRFFRAKALAERAVAASPLATTIFAPSIIYDRDDPWVTMIRRLALLPLLPVSGSGQAAFEPIWAADVARCVISALDGRATGRFELAGPEILTYERIARLIAAASGRRRPVVHVPLNIVRLVLRGLRRAFGEAAFATWEEAELLEVPMVSARGTADAEGLGVHPSSMREVLGT